MRKAFISSQSNTPHTLLLVLFLIQIITIFFAEFSDYSNYVLYPIWALWLTVILSSEIILNRDERAFIKVSFVFLMIVLIYWVIGYSSTVIGDVLNNINWILVGVISLYVLKLFSERELSVVYITLAISSLILLVAYISMGRVLMAAEQNEEAALVTSAWYGSLSMLLSGLSLIVFIHVKSIFPRIISITFFILTLYLNFFVLQRGTNVIFTLSEIGILLVFTMKRKSLVYFFSIVIVVLVIYVYSSGLLIVFFDGLADIIPSDRLANRFREISSALYYEDIAAGSGSLSGRNELIMQSFHTFTSSVRCFLFGAGEHFTDDNIIGHHSFIIDTFARYGIIGGVLMFIYFKKQYQIIMSFLNKHKDWTLYMQCAIVFMFYILRNIYGVFAYTLVNLFILVFFPLTFQIINYFKKQ